MTIQLIETYPDTADAISLIDELSQRLKSITGSSGGKNFTAESVQERGVFVVAYRDGQACGCGPSGCWTRPDGRMSARSNACTAVWRAPASAAPS